MQQKNYDYIFFGAGCASLSIVMRMIGSKKFTEKSILIVDREPKTKNDRTWCFWEKEDGFFEDIVYCKWNELVFNTSGENPLLLDIGSYQYKMIRGIDFYEKCFSAIKVEKNIDVEYGEIFFEETKNDGPFIKINDNPLSVNSNAIIFNSIFLPPLQKQDKFYLLQHFKGWIIETTENFFNEKQATLMDFRVSQNEGTAFVYVLPLSPKKALIEFTLFSENLLAAEDYDLALKNYLKEFLHIGTYKILEEEFGIIPMTNANFPPFKQGMYFIGTAGGQTKASTGYTFKFIQKQSAKIVKELISSGIPSKTINTQKRFFFYDSTLLHILSKKLLEGKTIFSVFFKKNRAEKIFKFLDNETTIGEEIKLLNTLPKKIFIKAGFKEFMKMIFRSDN
ncbi:MAG: lycopene cyclase family protein [Bacteroidota bacterium]|nr:lycopene cyclase family protein [Bacteroidota bacterium]